jgi:hypothetical protein
MKLIISFILLLLSYAHQVYCQGVQVKLGLVNKSTLESNKDEIIIPIKVTGDWPDSSPIKSFKLKINFDGDAAKSFDYTADKSEFIISKDKLDDYFVKLNISNNIAVEPDELIILSLSAEDGGELVKVDPAKCTITITERNEVGLRVISNVNNDKDTSEVFGKFFLNKAKYRYGLSDVKLTQSLKKEKIFTKYKRKKNRSSIHIINLPKIKILKTKKLRL